MQKIGKMIAVLALLAGVAEAQAPAVPKGFRGEFLTVIGQIETKVIRLADAMTEAKWDWKPTGARSTCEVLMHMAVDKYLFGAPLGLKRPAALSGNTAEQCPATKAQAKVLLTQAFKDFNDAVLALPDGAADDPITLFGMQTTKRGVLLMTAEHAGEHLGQLIAYARMNGVTPPWSR
jgi:uncharacterized damage-inducible protein DinB